MERIKVKILGFSCGDRVGGNTAWMVQYSLKVMEKFGGKISEIADVETDFFDVADKEIKPYINSEEGAEIPGAIHPAIEDDYFAREIETKVARADGFVFGSSVHNASFSSKFKLLIERLYPLIGKAHLTNKPATSIAVGYGSLWGLENCLHDMNNCFRALEMVVCTRLTGCPVSTGSTLGAEGSKVAAAKKDRYAQWLASNQARRVVEVAVKQKVAKRLLGDIYEKEFIKTYHPPYGNEPWAWWRLDKEEEEYMMNL